MTHLHHHPGTLEQLGDTLRAHAFGELVETARDRGDNRREPWLSAPALGLCAGSSVPGPSAAWLRAAHLGERVADDAAIVGDGVPGGFALSSARGLLAAADREYGVGRDDVHLGEDSLRFTDAVLAAAPRGSVVEVGTGSGIAAAAAARTCERVTAVDVLPGALEAARITAGLNHVADRIDLDVADFRSWTPARVPDVVLANLPGVPVPADVAYPVAGDGGPDGLALIRPLWHWVAELFGGGSGRGSGGSSGSGRLVMRFQALGDDRRPAVLGELREVFGPRADVAVITDSRVPTLVRNAITAVRAAALAGEESPLSMLARITAGTDAIGGGYHCSTLRVRLDGEGRTTHVFTGADLRLEPLRGVRLHGHGTGDAGWRELAASFTAALPGMPDEFWSIEGEAAAAALLADLPAAVEALADGLDPEAVAAQVLGRPETGDLIAHAGAVTAVALLASQLRVDGLTGAATSPATVTDRTPPAPVGAGAGISGGGA
ncbi:MAG: 50S ribosomal protein L11 methyltransferase [Kineosporiaceae bacterium]